MNAKTLEQIKAAVSKINVAKRDTTEGRKQREDFKRRWNVSSSDL